MEINVLFLCSILAILVLIANCFYNTPPVRLVIASDPCSTTTTNGFKSQKSQMTITNTTTTITTTTIPISSLSSKLWQTNLTCKKEGVPLIAYSDNGNSLKLTISESCVRPVYDLITFNDELLILRLELRMRELADVVDFL